jgi:AraC-like DNA-binding protein
MIRRQVRLDDSGIRALVEEYRRHPTSLDDLAAQFGVHRHTAARHLDDAGITERRKMLGAAQIADAVNRYRNGWSLAKIARHLGVAPTSVNYRLRQAGVQLRPRPGSQGHET